MGLPKGYKFKTKRQPLSNQTKLKISNKLKGRVFSEETITKMSMSHKGHITSESTKKKLSEVAKGHIVLKETREKISKSNKGRKRSDEAKENIRKGHLNKGPVSNSARKNMSEAGKGHKGYWKGRSLSNDHKLKIGQSQKGKIISDEQKRKQRITNIKNIEKNYGICYPAYNKKACEFFKLLDKNLNTKGRYAVYGNGEFQIKELGYFIDYINFDKKLIIEWDEEHHFRNNQLKEKDIRRQQEIQNFYPDFKFQRIREKEFTNII